VGTLAAGYSIVQTSDSTVDLMGGARYLRLKAAVDYEIVDPFGGVPARGTLNRTKDIWDGVVGLRGRSNIGDKWFVPFAADIGAGTSRFTWEAFAGVGYRFDWGDVTLGYRHVSYRFSNDNPVADMSFGGPLVGVGFHF